MRGLDRLVTIQANTPGQDATGAPTDSWGTFATLWARRLPAPGRESFAGDYLRSETVAIFRIRSAAGVTAQMRLVDGSDTWNIEDVQLSRQRRKFMDLVCRMPAPGDL